MRHRKKSININFKFYARSTEIGFLLHLEIKRGNVNKNNKKQSLEQIFSSGQ